MRRGGRWLAAMAVATPLLLGMGGGGAGPVSDTIPRPEQSFAATLKDRQGVVTRVEHLAAGGKTFLPLRRGEGTLLVPFDKVQRLELGEAGPRGLAATVVPAGGEALTGALDGDLEFTGETDLGNYRVPARGVAEVSFR